MQPNDVEKKNAYINGLALLVYAFVILRWFLYSTTVVVNWPEHYREIWDSILLVAVLGKLLYTKNRERKRDWILLLICFVFLIARQYNGVEQLYDMALLIILLQDIPFKQIVKTHLVTIGIAFITTAICSQMDVITNLVYVRPDSGIIRNSFGICYPTDCAAYVFFLILDWIYLRQKRMKWFDYVLIIGGAWFTSYFCDARLSFSCIVMVGMLVFGVQQLLKLSETNEKAGILWEKGNKIFCLAVPIAVLITLVLNYGYKENISVLNMLNRVLSGRLANGHYACENYGIRWWGQPIRMQGNGGTSLDYLINNYFFIDSIILQLLLMYGLAVFLIVIGAMTIRIAKARKEKDVYLFVILSVLAVNAMVEHHMMELNYNVFLFALFGQGILMKDKMVSEESGKTEPVASVKRWVLPVFFILYGIGIVLFFQPFSKQEDYVWYGLGTTGSVPSGEIEKETAYRQYFYAPRRVDGIQIQFATYGTKANKDLKITFYDGETGEKIGKETISRKKIQDNLYTQVPFHGYSLEEGKQYYFEIQSKKSGKNPIVCWMGTRNSIYVGDLQYQGQVLTDTGICFDLLTENNVWFVVLIYMISMIFVEMLIERIR